MDRFVTRSPNKTPPMRVQVIDASGEVSYVYKAPAGFQLDRYVASLFPNADLMISATPHELNVSVIIPDNNEIYQIHRGIYETDSLRY
jgi:hypothetical protein